MANLYKNAKLDLSTTNLTNIITAATGSTIIVKSILVSEDSGSTPNITITLVESSNIFSIFKSKALSANQTLELLDKPLVIQAGEILKAQASAANQLHLIVSYLEITWSNWLEYQQKMLMMLGVWYQRISQMP